MRELENQRVRDRVRKGEKEKTEIKTDRKSRTKQNIRINFYHISGERPYSI